MLPTFSLLPCLIHLRTMIHDHIFMLILCLSRFFQARMFASAMVSSANPNSHAMPHVLALSMLLSHHLLLITNRFKMKMSSSPRLRETSQPIDLTRFKLKTSIVKLIIHIYYKEIELQDGAIRAPRRVSVCTSAVNMSTSGQTQQR